MKIKIDLFKSGAFPVIDLFKDGPARAVGYRRVYVTSKGKAIVANIDPTTLVPLRFSALPEHLEGALNFAGSNAQEALAQVRVLLDKAMNSGERLETNGLHRALRRYFWELDSAISIALTLSDLRVGLHVDRSLDWAQLVTEWRDRDDNAQVLDELALLGFSWYGVDLYEVRTYAELCRKGTLNLQAVVSNSGDRVLAVVLAPCRQGGTQIIFEGDRLDGLDRFLDSSRRFVQRLLRLSYGVGDTRRVSSNEVM